MGATIIPQFRKLLLLSAALVLANGACTSAGPQSEPTANEASVPPMKWKVSTSGGIAGDWSGMDARAETHEEAWKLFLSSQDPGTGVLMTLNVPDVEVGDSGRFETSKVFLSLGTRVCEVDEDAEQGLRITFDEFSREQVRGSIAGHLECDTRRKPSMLGGLWGGVTGDKRPDKPVMEPTEISGEFQLTASSG